MPKVNLSPFMCKELIYDYVMGDLNGDRKLQFEKILNEDEDLKKEYDHIKFSFSYLSQLEKLSLSEVFIEDYIADRKIENAPKKKNKRSNDYSPWDYGRKLVEAVVLAGLVFGAIKFIPDNFFQEELPQKRQTETLLTSEFPVKKNTEDVVDIEIPEDKLEHVEESLIAESGHSPVAIDKEDPNNVAMDQASGMMMHGEEELVDEDSEADLKINQAANSSTGNKNDTMPTPKGFVYRLKLRLDNIDPVADQLVMLINEKGGNKAGNVELGWKKPKARYFHFAIDEVELSNIEAFIAKHSSLKLVKSSHWRVMPKGKVRIILEIIEK